MIAGIRVMCNESTVHLFDIIIIVANFHVDDSAMILLLSTFFM